MKNYCFFLLLSIHAIFTFSLHAMEQLQYVSIINENEEQHLEIFSNPNDTYSIFGATPKFSALTDYYNMTQDHINKLKKLQKTTPSLKGVAHKQKGVCKELLSINPEVTSLTLDQQVEFFFKKGLDNEKLKENIKNLISAGLHYRRYKNATGTHHLFHILLPSYFTDLKKDQISSETLMPFLKKSALLYAQLYNEVVSSGKNIANNTIRFYIIIPSFCMFQKYLNNFKPTTSKYDALIPILQSSILKYIDKKYMNQLVLINAHEEEVKDMATRIQELYSTKEIIETTPLSLTMGNNSKANFNPYILTDRKKNQKDLYRSSPLITQELLALFKEKA